MVLQLKLSHTIGSTSTTTNCSVPFILVSAGNLDRLWGGGEIDSWN
jgi:hypothetical protein